MVAIIDKHNSSKHSKNDLIGRALQPKEAPNASNGSVRHTTEQKQNAVAEKILLVDDCRITRTIISGKLKKHDFEILQASSGLEALETIKTVTPDLILLDVMMDGIDGMETCRRIKAQKEFAQVPIIFLSGKADKEHVVAGLSCGASDYITKPFDAGEAIARIKNHLKISQLSLEKEKANQQLQQANAAKDKLLGVTSHDLKNPLSAIRGLGEYLASGQFGSLNEEQTEMINQIIDASNGMLDLVNDLLCLSVLEGNSCQPKLQENELSSFVYQLTKQMSVNAAKKNINLECHEDPTLACFTQFDDRLIRRVVQNFVGNAIKFSPANTTISVRVYATESGFSVEVDDGGPGVPQDEQHKLFQEYGQTSVKTTGGESSTGLGLSICKKIVEAHQGTVGMKNLEPKGARFFFTLPKQLEPQHFAEATKCIVL